jgi:hypothetical protein
MVPAQIEVNHSLGWHLYSLSAAGVAPLPGPAITQAEAPETAKLYPFASFEGRDDALQEGLDQQVSILLPQL